MEEKHRMTGPKADLTSKAFDLVEEIVNTTLTKLIPDPAPMLCAAGGLALPALTAIAKIVASPKTRMLDTTLDNVIFGSCYLIAATDLHSQGLMVEFSGDAIRKAIQLFKKLTDREYTNIDPGLLQMLQAEPKTDIPVHVRKFLN
jgi:hypothetical protein